MCLAALLSCICYHDQQDGTRNSNPVFGLCHTNESGPTGTEHHIQYHFLARTFPVDPMGEPAMPTLGTQNLVETTVNHYALVQQAVPSCSYLDTRCLSLCAAEMDAPVLVRSFMSV